jgi:hypothetical protein
MRRRNGKSAMGESKDVEIFSQKIKINSKV